MVRTGIGQDGYLRMQKESIFGTPIMTVPVDIPLKSGGLFKGYEEMIENENIINSRLKQAPDSGRLVCPLASPAMDYYPDIVGLIYNLLFGAASSVDNTDGSYTHTWLVPKAGERIAKSYTAEQAIGADLADQFAGCTITAIVIEGDTSGNMQITFETRPQDYTEDVARAATFIFPTTIPFNWSFSSHSMTPSGGAAKTDACINSMTLRIDLKYDLERYKYGSKLIKQPVYDSIPEITLDMNVDAERLFLTDARILKEWDLVLTFTSTEDAGTSSKYSTVFELPGARLSPETEIPNDNSQLSMDLSFNCSYGGQTTGSPASAVMGEVRTVDAVAAYA